MKKRGCGAESQQPRQRGVVTPLIKALTQTCSRNKRSKKRVSMLNLPFALFLIVHGSDVGARVAGLKRGSEPRINHLLGDI